MSEQEIQQKIGGLLKIERERQNIKLENLAETLKISEEHLSAIDAGRASDLPSDLYFSLFAKSYAEALGIDYAATVQAIKEDIDEREEKAEAEARKARGDVDRSEGVEQDGEIKYGFRKKLIYMFVGIIVACIVFAFGYNWLVGSSTESTDASDGQENSAGPEENAWPPANMVSYDYGTPPETPPEKIRLTLQAREESWATIFADGDTAIFRSLNPGRLYRVDADYRLVVSVAHPSKVDMTLNDKPVDLRDPDNRNRVSRVRIDQVNLASFFEPRPARQQEAERPTRQQEVQPPTPTPVQTQETAPAASPPIEDTAQGANEVTP